MNYLIAFQAAVCVLIALLYCLQKMNRRWQLILPVFALILPQTIHILAQWQRIRMPSLWNWISRLLVAGIVAIAFIAVSETSLVDNQLTRAFKANGMMLFSEHALTAQGDQIFTSDGSTHAMPSFGRTACAIASVAVLYGALFFQHPYRKMLAFAAIGFAIGTTLDCAILAATIDASVNQGHLNVIAHREAYSTGAAYSGFAIHWLTFALAAWLSHRAIRFSTGLVL